MTLKNCIRLLKAYKDHANDESLRSHVRKMSQYNYDNLKAKILKDHRFKDHPILEELKEPLKEKEVKKDVKKPKRRTK